MASLEEQAKKFEVKAVMVSLIVSAFGFVAALFWRDAISEFITQVIPAGQGLAYQFVAAVVVTLMAVIVIFILTKYVANFSLQAPRKPAARKSRKRNIKTKR